MAKKKEKGNLETTEKEVKTGFVEADLDVDDGEELDVDDSLKALANAGNEEDYIYQFAHADKYHYIPARSRQHKAIQFIRGKYGTNDPEEARYIMSFDGVVCLSDNLGD